MQITEYLDKFFDNFLVEFNYDANSNFDIQAFIDDIKSSTKVDKTLNVDFCKSFGNIKHLIVDKYMQYANDNTLTNVIIDKITNYDEIGHFQDQILLQTIEFNNNIKTIPSRFCIRCINLQNIIFPAKLNIINEDAFADCLNLQSISLPEDLKEIHRYAFANCLQLREVYIPHTIKLIEKYVFKNCINLHRVVFY